MLHKSIRWRLQVWHGALLVCLVTGMLGAFYVYERAESFRLIDNKLQALLTPLLPQITPPGGRRGPDGPGFDGERPPPDSDDEPGLGRGRRPPARNQGDFAEFKDGSFYYAAWRPNRELIAQSAGATVAKIPIPERGAAGGGQFYRARGTYREIAFFGPNGDCVLVGASTAQAAGELRRLAWILVATGLGLTTFGLAGGWWVAGHALRPIGEISETARHIAGGNRARRIDLRETESELGQLAELLNRTFDEQDRAFEQQVRFTADASHELRTPLSVILTQIQVALSRERDAQSYRETLQTCQRAAERMRALVNSLLELARVDSGEFKLNLAECDLAALAAESLELVAPLALEKGAVLQSSVQPVRTRADPTRLGQVIVNLLYNAINHNRNGVEVRLTVRSRGNEALLRISDNGAGIPAGALPHLFERFYRVDKSRSKSNGSGLGLAISQAIVQAHGGTIRAESQPGQGAVFTVSLPLAN